MTKIDRMTPEQEAKIPVYLDKYLKAGRRTAPMDQVKVEELITKLYEGWLGGTKPLIVHCQSPLQLCVFPSIYREIGKLDLNRNNLWNNLENNLGNKLWSNLWNNLRNNLGNNLRNNLENNLWNNLENNLWNNLGNNLGNNLENNLWNNLGNNLGNNLENNLWSNLRNNLGNNLENNLGNNLENNLWNNLWNNLENNLWNNLGNNLRNNLENNLGNNLWNNLGNNLRNNLENTQFVSELNNIHWCSWWWNYRAVHEFAHTEIIGTYPEGCKEKLDFVNELFAEVHAIVPYKGICFVSDFPTVINIDDRGRLHSELGPAITYSDTYSMYALHGVRLENGKEKYIQDRDTLTVEAIESESSNAEVRRVLTELYGLERYIQDSGAIRQHEDDFGVLLRKKVEGDEDLVMVKVVNSTPEPDGSYKDYFIRVPPTVTKAKEAVAWTFGKTEEEYIPLVQT